MQGVRFYEISPRVTTSDPSNTKSSPYKTMYDHALAAALGNPYASSKSVRVKSGSIKSEEKPMFINWMADGEVIIDDPTNL